MSAARSRGPIVIDTDVFSADLVPGSRLAERYAALITGRPAFISFQTVAEMHYGALRRGWGAARMLKLEARIELVEVVRTGPELVLACAQLRADCETAGHALAQRGTTPIAGSPRPRSAWRSRSFPTTGSSAAFRASRSNRCRLPERAPLSPADRRVPALRSRRSALARFGSAPSHRSRDIRAFTRFCPRH